MNPPDELFSIAPCPSPRMTWLRANGISTKRTDLEPEDGKWPTEDEFGNDVWPWSAFSGLTRFNGEPIVGYGITEDDALTELAKALRIPLWNEESAPFAGVRRDGP